MAEVLIGTIVEWDSKRGFGFISCGGERVFVHVKDCLERHQPPLKGDRVAFVMGADAKGRPCAQEVTSLSSRSRLKTRHLFQLMGLLILPGLALSALPCRFILLAYFVVISVIASFYYRRDKASARSGAWRIEEARLHTLELLGGWPGAFLAQRILRHKTIKKSFQINFWLIVILYQIVAFESYTNWRFTKSIWGAAQNHADRVMQETAEKAPPVRGPSSLPPGIERIYRE